MKRRDICETIHYHGGQVYLDGANMNAQVKLIHCIINVYTVVQELLVR